MKNPIKNQKGFTLIELAVVIAILAILAALALPSFLHTREKAQQTTFTQNVQRLQQAGTIYALQNPGVATTWAPFAGQKAKKDIVITEANQHESWELMLSVWPPDPVHKGGTYTVTIDEGGNVTVTPDSWEE